MGRYIKDVQLDQPIDVVSMVMEDYIYHNRFSRTDWNGEMVYYLKDNHGRERYMKWSYAGGCFHVEAWLKGPMGKEMDLNGAGGGASRKAYRQSMEDLLVTLKNRSSEGLSGGHIGSDPIHHSADGGREHDTRKRDASWQNKPEPQRKGSVRPAGNTGVGIGGYAGNSYTGLTVGVIAFILGATIPFFGLLLGIWGLKKIQVESGNRMDTAGKVLCVVAIVESVLKCVFWVVAVVFNIVGF